MSLATIEPATCILADRKSIDRLHFDFRLTREDPRSWDCFAQACGATFRGAYRQAVVWQLKHHLFFSLRRYDIFAHSTTESRKIGQFAVGIGLRTRVFTDVLQILPHFRSEWQVIMQSVLRELGAGTYCYGSDWTTEPSRVDKIADMDGTVIHSEKKIDVYAVDFSSFSSWDHFHRSLSSNVKRNAAAALRCGININTNTASHCIFSNNLVLLSMKKKMFIRKGLKMNIIKAFIILLIRLYSLYDFIFVARASSKIRSISLFLGLQFGQDMYYLEGASIDKPGGAAWYLLVAMLRRAYDTSNGLGKCVLGPDDGTARNQTAWENLRRQRLQCRATPFATSIVTFSYAPNARQHETHPASHA